MHIFQPEPHYPEPNIKKKIFENLLTGDYVISTFKNLLHDCYLYLSDEGFKPELCESLHVSKYGGGDAPYFILFSNNIESQILKDFNRM